MNGIGSTILTRNSTVSVYNDKKAGIQIKMDAVNNALTDNKILVYGANVIQYTDYLILSCFVQRK